MTSKIFCEVSVCPICMDDPIGDLAITPCGHLFHTLCIVNSTSRKLECPVCRHHLQKDQIILITAFNIRKCETGIFSQIFPSINEVDIKNSKVLFDKISELMIKNENLDTQMKEIKTIVENLTIQNKVLKESVDNLTLLKDKFEKAYVEEMQAKKEVDKLRTTYREKYKDTKNKLVESQKREKLYQDASDIKFHLSKDDRGIGYINNIKKNDSIEDQASTFYKTCLILTSELNSRQLIINNFQAENKKFQEKIEEQKGIINDLEKSNATKLKKAKPIGTLENVLQNNSLTPLNNLVPEKSIFSQGKAFKKNEKCNVSTSQTSLTSQRNQTLNNLLKRPINIEIDLEINKIPKAEPDIELELYRKSLDRKY